MLAIAATGIQGSSATAAEFDGARAFEYLQTQCAFGPRPPGSKGHRRCLEWITKTCRQLDLETTHQSFRAYLRLTREDVRLTNVVAIHQPDNPRKVMLSAHWDTRPVADREMVPSRRNQPILGANDGASGVAALMELARVFQADPPKVGVVFAFFDGEDAGLEAGEGWCLGSRHIAENLAPAWKFEKGINLDMIGDRDLSIPIEGYSWRRARALTEAVWEVGLRFSPRAFKNRPGRDVYDDHISFLDEGMPYINIIDFEYRYWHTLEDTEDKCSAESLEQVGRVIASFVRAL